MANGPCILTSLVAASMILLCSVITALHDQASRIAALDSRLTALEHKRVGGPNETMMARYAASVDTIHGWYMHDVVTPASAREKGRV